jgi:hypothetical protein
VFLYGETGKQKTTFSSFMTQLYNRGSGIERPVRLNASTPSAIKLITENQDCVIVLDDLFPADSTQIRKKQEETLYEVVRCLADVTTPARMRGDKITNVKPQCGVLFTGEYVIGEGSDAARIIPVEMEDINREKLKHCQDNPLIVSTFYRYFIQWAVDNYNDIVSFLSDKLREYRIDNLGIHDRLQESLYFLDTSYYLMLSYCCEKGFFTESEAKDMMESFLERLWKILKCQNQRVGKKITVADSTVDYWEHIRRCYKDGGIFYAEDCTKYQSGTHDAVIHANCLCIRSEWFSRAFPNTPAMTVANSLNDLGVLERGQNSLSKQISKLNGKRFYFIRLEALNS